MKTTAYAVGVREAVTSAVVVVVPKSADRLAGAFS
jgi:hypothetical protein